MAAHKYAEISDQVRDLYLQGMSRKKISDALDIDESSVRYILYSQLDIKESNPRKPIGADLLNSIPSEKLNKIITLTNFGYNYHEVANDVDLLPSKVFRLITEAKKKNLIKKLV